MVKHELKTWPEYFQEILSGKKNFELRNNDRSFAKGDILILREYSPVTLTYTGHQIEKEISYIYFDCNKFGLQHGYVILVFKQESNKAEIEDLVKQIEQCKAELNSRESSIDKLTDKIQTAVYNERKAKEDLKQIEKYGKEAGLHNRNALMMVYYMLGGLTTDNGMNHAEKNKTIRYIRTVIEKLANEGDQLPYPTDLPF